MKITLEQLSPSQREIAEIIGINSYIKLVKRFGGSNGIYIPKYSELLKPSRDTEILEKFNGYNFNELAMEYNLSVRSIYNLVSGILRKRKNAPLNGQASFFEPNS